jgi:hypothetical protein
MAQTSDHVEHLNHASFQEVANETSKKSYHPPQLRDYGLLRDVTMTSGSGSSYDAGGPPIPIYAS